MAVSSGVAAFDAEGVPGVVHCRFLEQQQQHFELQWWRGKSSCLACCAFEMAAVDQILAWPERFIGSIFSLEAAGCHFRLLAVDSS
ncbi:hypothetical protein OPV22_019555 [Ensete ventricosum]|uniref:Uncharacterized protein n=1 Tax=Ensete ventricosum TaxID=4639 RepID=A0AAV8QN15_ENSVE|nr:hypothetical protein OPV22_019555 [Ensete ventricosum]